MASLKQKLKQILINRQHKLYEKEIAEKNLTYDSWIQLQEKKLEVEVSVLEENQKSYVLVSCDAFFRNKKAFLEHLNAEFVFLTLYEGEVSRFAFSMALKQFRSNENTILIYGDEDIQEENIRQNPWFKPDWSPDRFLSCFYFGGFLAVRASALKEACAFWQVQGKTKKTDRTEPESGGNSGNLRVPDLQEQYLQELYELIFEMLKMQNAFRVGHDKSGLSVCHLPYVLYHSKENGYERLKSLKLPDRQIPSRENTLVSVIIPSKDNPEVLFHCLDSLLARTETKYAYEIILVDNGSREENRKRIADKTERLNQVMAQKSMQGRAIYIYEPMFFNFSRMCNLGAEAAKGQLLLFLNDDMEIIKPDWMDLMIEKAILSYAGAVGAKLLYPDSDIIQHAGITNLRVGPAHKLQFLSDEQVHYFGMNRGVHDMLAVTGACLMVKKEVFEEAGGFCEKLAVAFNDVDLCYTIYEKGYYNIVRNDVVLYHHESLSRGKDGESEEKQLRLLKEKDVLYERHQELYGCDPFYHFNLTNDMLESEYSPAYHYQVTLDMPWALVEKGDRELAKAREDQCLVVGMECAMDIYKWQYGVPPEKGRVKAKPGDMGYYFQGYSFVIGSDNACYKKKLLLRNRESKQVWVIPVENRYRQDIRKNLKDQLNVDLTGFAAKMRREDIPAGIYQFGMLSEDRCSRLKLVNWSSWILEITR